MGAIDSLISKKFPNLIESMNNKALDIIPIIHRAEFDENPAVYMKAVRATLLALGYQESFIEGEFREKMEAYYDASSTRILI